MRRASQFLPGLDREELRPELDDEVRFDAIEDDAVEMVSTTTTAGVVRERPASCTMRLT
ncbi:MAG: hypothetical protein KBF76_12765 [Verrucomicrobiales bacterium]|nr:hypothetical protein [Verrucomicrobiales bacterium]